MEKKSSKRKSWQDLGVPLHVELTAAINSLNFPTMTPIQAATIPQLINKKDVVVEAVTGSGKTLAFLIPLLQMLRTRQEEWKKHEIGAVVISPTRELALQIQEVLDQLLVHIQGLSRVIWVGGSSVDDDLTNFKMKGGNIVICTPGRFEDLLTRRTDSVNLTSCLKSMEILVLDEADRLLDYGFKKTIDAILSYLPKQRRTGLFSATQTKQLQDLIRAGLRNPVVVSVTVKDNKHSTPESLENYYVVSNDNNKLGTLFAFIESKRVNKALLFLPTCACVDYWAAALPRVLDTQMEVLALHGKMKDKRKKVMQRFKSLDKGLLLCTDVLARGIDIQQIDWVFQWDPPASASAFVHRVGRTARQGNEGSSLIFLLDTEEAYVHFIEKNQRVKLNQLHDTSTQSEALTNRLRDLQKSDREIMEKATRAFVSHIRAYSKHECSLLLRVKELPFVQVAQTYGLLQLPKMPELRNVDSSSFDVCAVDTNAVPYKDKNRERARLEKLQVYKATGVWPGRKVQTVKKATEPWSEAKQKKVEKKEKRLKRKRAKSKDGGEAVKKKHKKAGVSEQELLELAKDIALMKKLKKKKITETEFDSAFGID